MDLTANQLERFTAKITRGNPDECWNWTASGLITGYGRVRINDRAFLAHRVAWSLAHGDPGESCVLHRCDNPKCCNVAHLFLGSHQDNMTDKAAKGRVKPVDGERNPRAILSALQVEEIRAIYIPRKTPLNALALKYGVSHSAIHSIIKRKTWA